MDPWRESEGKAAAFRANKHGFCRFVADEGGKREFVPSYSGRHSYVGGPVIEIGLQQMFTTCDSWQDWQMLRKVQTRK